VKQSKEINTQFVNLLRSKSKGFLNIRKQHRLNYTRIGAASMFFNHHIQFSLNYYFVSWFLFLTYPKLLFSRQIGAFYIHLPPCLLTLSTKAFRCSLSSSNV